MCDDLGCVRHSLLTGVFGKVMEHQLMPYRQQVGKFSLMIDLHLGSCWPVRSWARPSWQRLEARAKAREHVGHIRASLPGAPSAFRDRTCIPTALSPERKDGAGDRRPGSQHHSRNKELCNLVEDFLRAQLPYLSERARAALSGKGVGRVR